MQFRATLYAHRHAAVRTSRGGGMVGATSLLVVWLATSTIGLAAAETECTGEDCSEETCPCVLMPRRVTYRSH